MEPGPEFQEGGHSADGASTSGTSSAYGPKFNGQMYYQYDPQTLGQSPERAAVPPAIVSGLVGGIRTVLESRVGAGETAALPDTMPALRDWALAYRNPPQPIRRPRSRPPLNSVSRFVVHDQVDRIFGAVAAT